MAQKANNTTRPGKARYTPILHSSASCKPSQRHPPAEDERLEELRGVPPLSLHAPVAVEPVPRVVLRAALRPLLELHLPADLGDGEVLVVDPRDLHHREALFDHGRRVLHVEVEQADVSQLWGHAGAQLL